MLWGSPREKPHSHGGRNSSESSHQLSWRCTREHWGRHMRVCCSLYLVTADWVCTSTPQCSKTKADQDNTSQLGLGTHTRPHCLPLCGAALQLEHMPYPGNDAPCSRANCGLKGWKKRNYFFPPERRGRLNRRGTNEWPTEAGQPRGFMDRKC